MEAENLQNGTAVEGPVTGIENGDNVSVSDTVGIEPCVENGGVPVELTSEAQHLKDGFPDFGDTAETIGSVPEKMSVSDDVTVNGLVSNGDIKPLDITSDITTSGPESNTVKMSGKDLYQSDTRVSVEVPKKNDLASQDSEDLFFDPSPDETEAEQWHEAGDNTQHASIITNASQGHISQPATSLLPQLEINTENHSAFIPVDGAEVTGEQIGEICNSDKTDTNQDSSMGQLDPQFEENSDRPVERENESVVEPRSEESNENVVDPLCGANNENVKDSHIHVPCEENQEGILDPTNEENKEIVHEATLEEHKDSVLVPNSEENKDSVLVPTTEENKETVLDQTSEENKETVRESLCKENNETILDESTVDETQITVEGALSKNSASIDLGKFGAISLSAQLSTQMSEGVGNLVVAQEGDIDGLAVDDMQQPDTHPADIENQVATDIVSTDPLPAVTSDQPLGFPSIEPLPISNEGENMSETFMEKAVGSGRKSVERKTYEMSPGHVEIDLSAQLENIFAGDNKISDLQHTPKSAHDAFPDSPKTKTFDSQLLTKKENADSGVDNDDEFESLDKEIVMLRERYRSTQDRIQKALKDDTSVGRRSKEMKEMSPETAYAKFRAQRLGSAPVFGEKYDCGVVNTLSGKMRMEKESGFRTANYGARRIVADQTELCSKLKNASQSFEELEEEIRSLKYDFLESQAKRDQFFEDYDRDVEEQEQGKGYGGYGSYGTSEENPYLNYYLNRPPPSQADDEFEFRLPSTTRKPWSSYSRSHTEDPGMYTRRDYRGKDMDGTAGGYYSAPLYSRDRPKPKDRVSSLEETKKREVVSDISEEPSTYKPGKATSEFLRQIYAGQQSKPFSFEPDWEGDIDSVESVKYGNSKSPWKPTSQDYRSGYEPKSQQKYKLDDYNIDDSESGHLNRNYNTSYKSDKFSYGKGREYGARSSTANDSDNALKVGTGGKANWDDNAFTGSLPRDVSRAGKQKHQDKSSVDCKRDNSKWDGKPSKYNFQYDLGTDLGTKSTKSKYANKWDDASPDRSTKSKYSSRSKELEISPETPRKSKYSSGKSDYSDSKSDYMNFKSEYSSSKSDYSGGKPEKPFTSRFLQKRQEARESAEAKSKSGEGKPFQSRFLRKSTGDLTSLDDSSKPPKLNEANSDSKSTE